jgi:hypothetical protein
VLQLPTQLKRDLLSMRMLPIAPSTACDAEVKRCHPASCRAFCQLVCYIWELKVRPSCQLHLCWAACRLPASLQALMSSVKNVMLLPASRLLEHGHAPYIETVPFRIIFAFTLLQLVGLGAVYGITKAGVRCNPRVSRQQCTRLVLPAVASMCHVHTALEAVAAAMAGHPPTHKLWFAEDSACVTAADLPLDTSSQIVGVIFPVFIMALVPIRQYIMPRFFKREHLRELDAAPYEEVTLRRCNAAYQPLHVMPHCGVARA